MRDLAFGPAQRGQVAAGELNRVNACRGDRCPLGAQALDLAVQQLGLRQIQRIPRAVANLEVTDQTGVSTKRGHRV
jgi:hypothetical protein